MGAGGKGWRFGSESGVTHIAQSTLRERGERRPGPVTDCKWPDCLELEPLEDSLEPAESPFVRVISINLMTPVNYCE